MDAEEYEKRIKVVRELMLDGATNIRFIPKCRFDSGQCTFSPDNGLHFPAEADCKWPEDHHDFDAYGYTVEFDHDFQVL